MEYLNILLDIENDAPIVKVVQQLITFTSSFQGINNSPCDHDIYLHNLKSTGHCELNLL